MVLQNGIALASSLIRTHFGDLVGKVCECLLRKGTLTLPELIRFTELPSLQVRNCLLVLIQHNCVLDFSVEKEGGIGDQSKMVVHYTALFDNIIHRMRFSKFLAIVTEELDKECKELFEGLLQHGRLTLEQVILRAVLHPEDGNIAVQDGIRASFVKLVNAHYVERCPDFKPSIPLPDPEEKKTTTAGRAPKSAKLVAQREKTQEEEAIAMSACSEGRRFDITINYGTNVKAEARIEGTTPILVGEKRKHESLESEHDSEKEDLWRVNFDEFVRRLRHKACVTSVRSQLDDGAGTVLNAMLEATRSERKVKTDETDPLSINTIYQEVINREEGRTMDLDRVRNALVQLECQIIKESSYSANLKNIIEKAQNTEVESIVEKRYGMDACRIYRFLSQTGHLAETDKIADAAFVEKKDALKTLYTLWENRYLEKEKIQLSTQVPKFLWKVIKPPLWEVILDEMHHAALNLNLRMADELEKEHEILQLPKDKRVGALGERFERIRKVKILMESSLMKLDDALMLFHDF